MSAPTPRRIEELLQNLEDCSLTGAEHADLMRLLRSDPSIRTTYIKHMEFAGLLHAKAEALAELNESEPMHLETPSARRFLRPIFAAAAVLMLAGFVANLLHDPNHPPASIVASPYTSWEFSHGGLDPITGFERASVISLESGTLDIHLGTGTQLVLEGPAELSIDNPTSVSLPHGRLWVRAASKQFIVSTQRLKIIDLGTEFGVLASDHLDEEVHVISGRVRIKPKLTRLPAFTLTSGEAVRANRIGKLRSIPFTSSGFLTAAPSELHYLHWSFDSAPEGEFHSTGRGLPTAAMSMHSMTPNTLLTPTPIAGRFGKALQLNHSASFARAEFSGIEGDVPRTVAFWVKGVEQTNNPEINPTLVAWGLPTEFGTKWRLTINTDGTSIGTVWGGAWASSSTPANVSILDGTWHHLAYVFDGSYDLSDRPNIIHYLDGNALDNRHTAVSMPVNTECNANYSRPLTLGAQILSKPSRDTFIGAMDELYVFRGALRPYQIRSLYESNQP